MDSSGPYVGGALFLAYSVFSGEIRIQNSAFTNNEGSGGLYVFDAGPGTAVHNCTFEGNKGMRGSGMLVDMSPHLKNFTISRCSRFQYNEGYKCNEDQRCAEVKGAALYNARESVIVRITECTFTANRALSGDMKGSLQANYTFAGYGGAVYNAATIKSIDSCKFDAKHCIQPRTRHLL